MSASQLTSSPTATVPAVRTLRVDPAATTLTHRSLESGNCILHLLAGARLSCDAKARSADAEHSSAAVLEVDVREDEVCAPDAGTQMASDLSHELLPSLERQRQCHLPATAAIGAAFEADSSQQIGALSEGPSGRRGTF